MVSELGEMDLRFFTKASDDRQLVRPRGLAVYLFVCPINPETWRVVLAAVLGAERFTVGLCKVCFPVEKKSLQGTFGCVKKLAKVFDE